MKILRKSPVGRPPAVGRKVRFPEFAERFQGLAAKKRMTRQDFVRPYTNMNDATLGNYWRGDRLPHPRHARAIAERLGITVDYLLYGDKGQAPTFIEVPISPITEEERMLLRDILDKLER